MAFVDPKTLSYHPLSETVVHAVNQKVDNPNEHFVRLMTGYYFAIAASMMRAKILTHQGDYIPINLYGINLSPSGTSKGHSNNILEEEVMMNFRHRFREYTFPKLAEKNFPHLAQMRAQRYQTQFADELSNIEREFDRQGPVLFVFDAGTSPAVKQARHTLLMANAGALNLQMDEVGSNLGANMDLMKAYLELYDMGKIKSKLTKNTVDNLRNDEIEGATPTNMMLFGTPAGFLSGDKTEEEFINLLTIGYGRRCFFNYTQSFQYNTDMTALDLISRRADSSIDQALTNVAKTLGGLADPIHAHKEIMLTEEVDLIFGEYELDNKRKANKLREHEEVQRIEMAHRQFKAKKLAGVYAFVDGSPEIQEEHALAAIKMAEDSADALSRILTREKPYARVARYIAQAPDDVTQADMYEELPYFPKAQHDRNAMLQLATAWGYKNNIVIKKDYADGIEFYSADALEETNLAEMRVSYSDELAHNYNNDLAPFDQLHTLTQLDGMHWANHHFIDGHRCEENAAPGFNMVVLDVEKSVTLEVAKDLLKDYKALYYTTKRHTADEHRFRIVLPTNFVLHLSGPEFKEFMNNLFEWLPFEVDDCTGQRARKWLSHDGEYEYTEGELLDVLPFIPKTSKNEERKRLIKDQSSLDNLERWVMNNTGGGNRNNQLLKYALLLVDSGFTGTEIQEKVLSLNSKMPDRLVEAEILGTIMVTVAKRLSATP